METQNEVLATEQTHQRSIDPIRAVIDASTGSECEEPAWTITSKLTMPSPGTPLVHIGVEHTASETAIHVGPVLDDGSFLGYVAIEGAGGTPRNVIAPSRGPDQLDPVRFGTAIDAVAERLDTFADSGHAQS